MNRLSLVAGISLALACAGERSGSSLEYAAFRPGPTPPELHRGEVLFNTYCQSCHGLHGTGQGLGPALLDTLYRPDRLPDSAIQQAVEQGVRQQYWNFGAMPPIQRLEAAEVPAVIAYVRWLQARVAGAATNTPVPRETN